MELLSDIEASVKNNFTPGPDKALRFLCMDVNTIKIIILGQDPYPQAGAATGRAFEVAGLKSWNERFRQSSLRNILRNIHASYTPGGLKTLNEIREEIESGEFIIAPPDKIFDAWQDKGVLCLNTAFTCAVDTPGSHADIWRAFTVGLIGFIADKNKNIIWFLWGKYALAYEKYLGGAKTYKCGHPMLPGTGGDGFLNCKCFSETKHIVDWTGRIN